MIPEDSIEDLVDVRDSLGVNSESESAELLDAGGVEQTIQPDVCSVTEENADIETEEEGVGLDSINTAIEDGAPRINPGKVVSLVNTAIELFKMQITIGTRRVAAIIDSGAAASLISSELVKSLGLDGDGRRNVLAVVGTQNMITEGSVQLDFTVGGVVFRTTKFCISTPSAGLNVDVLLGVDFLKDNKIELFVKNRLVRKYEHTGQKTDLYLHKNGEIKNIIYSGVACYASADTVVAAGHV